MSKRGHYGHRYLAYNACYRREAFRERGTSVLSASSIVFDGDGKILDYFNRFYFPEESGIDSGALRVHRLTLERIAYFRREEGYADHFLQDADSLADFWRGWGVRGVIIHNVSFDIAFLPKVPGFTSLSWWCSMAGLTDFCRLPGRKEKYKWPKMGEAAAAVRDNCPTPGAVAENERSIGGPVPHYSLSDCFELYGASARILSSCPELVSFDRRSWRHMPPRPGETMRNPLPLKDDFVAEGLAYGANLADAAGQPDRAAALRSL